MKRIILSSSNLDLTQQFINQIRKTPGVKVLPEGIIYTSEDNDYTCGARMDYISYRLAILINNNGETLDSISVDDVLTQYETYVRTYRDVPDYTQRKQDIMYQLGYRTKSSTFYESNKELIQGVYSIASLGKPLTETVLKWCNSCSTVDATLAKWVKVSNNSVTLTGGPYGLGLPAITLLAANLNTDYSKKYRTPEQEKIVEPTISKMLQYLSDNGIDATYLERRKVITFSL